MKNLLLLFFILIVGARSQSIIVFDIDTSNYPNMKAKFFAFDNDGSRQTPSISELKITENGFPRTITNIKCPASPPPKQLSSVLVMDVSGSMGVGYGGPAKIDLMKVAASSWINALPLNSECAITSFDNYNYLNHDFTNDKGKLLASINTMYPQGGTDYDMAMINPAAGGLLISKRGKFQKIIIFLSDGYSMIEPNMSKILNEAMNQNCIIYCVTLGMRAPESMKEMAKQTGGQYFENVTTIAEAQNIYQNILQLAQNQIPCEIEWVAESVCNIDKVNLELTYQTAKAQSEYYISRNKMAFLSIAPKSIKFLKSLPGMSYDTTISLTAMNKEFKIINITDKYGKGEVSIVNNSFPFTIPKNKSKEITLRYKPLDSSSFYIGFNIETDECENYFSVTGGSKGKKLKEKSLKLIRPNGGEEFVIGFDTLITWEGVSPSDTMKLDYSVDNGLNWKDISITSSGLEFNWQNIPLPTSNKCLMRVSQPINSNSQNNNNSSIEWLKSYGGSNFDFAYSAQKTEDGGFIVTGYVSSNDGDVIGNYVGNIWVLKLDGSGNKEWAKSFGGTYNDWGKSIQQTADGGYIVAGHTESKDGDIIGNHGANDSWILKLDGSGNKEWAKCFGGSNYDATFSIQQTADGGYIAAGETASNNDGDVSGNNGEDDVWLIKIDSSGNKEWAKCFGGSGSELANSILQTVDGGYIIAGTSKSNDGDINSNHGEYDFLVLKIDSSGNKEWVKCFGGSADDKAKSIQKTADGGYIVSGSTNSNDGDVTDNHGAGDVWVLKIDSSGNKEWAKCFGGSGSEIANCIQLTSDNGYVMAGVTNSNDGDIIGNHGGTDYWILKVDITGNKEWAKCFGGSNNEEAYSINETEDGGYIVAGQAVSKDGDVSGNHGREDFWVIKMSSSEKDILQSDVSDNVFSIVSPEISSHDIDMGKVLVGDVKDSVIVDFIQNIGLYKCKIDSIAFKTNNNDFSQVSFFAPNIVEVSKVQATELRFKPTNVGIISDSIFIYTASKIYGCRIFGEGIQQTLSINTKIVDFDSVVVGFSKDSLCTVLIINNGSISINFTGIEFAGPNKSDFTLTSGLSDTTFVLQPNESVAMQLNFKPSDVGRTSTLLKFNYNGVGSPAVVQLFGIGVKDANAILVAGSARAKPGEYVDIPINFISGSNLALAGINTIQAELAFNKSILYPINQPNVREEGDLKVVTFDAPTTNITVGSPLKTISFQVALGTVEYTELILRNSIAIGGDADITVESGTFILDGICFDGGARLLNGYIQTSINSINPNPAKEEIEIEYSNADNGFATISIIDVMGQVIKEINLEKVQNGRVKVNLDGFSNGFYFCQFRTESYLENLKFLIVK